MRLADEVFGFYIPTVTLMGSGSHIEIGKQVKILKGKNPLIVTDKGIVKAGILKKITDIINKEAAATCEIFNSSMICAAYELIGSNMSLYPGLF